MFGLEFGPGHRSDLGLLFYNKKRNKEWSVVCVCVFLLYIFYKAIIIIMDTSMVCPALHYVTCQCAFDHVWQNQGLKLIIYPRSKLIACKGLLYRYLEPTCSAFGFHRLSKIMLAGVIIFPHDNEPTMCLALLGDRIGSSTDWRLAVILHGVGLTRVRRLQQWFRRMKWQPRALVVMMSGALWLCWMWICCSMWHYCF